MKAALTLLPLALAAALSPSVRAEPRPISFTQVLKLAAQHSPRVSAAELRASAAESSASAAKSGYLPSINFELEDGTGFPGSAGAVDVTGLMNSPYHDGIGAGLVAKETLWDFGRTSNAVKSAQLDAKALESDAETVAEREQQIALRSYVDCAMYRSLRGEWTGLRGEADLITKEVARFTRTGQRSIAEKLLAQAQYEEAFTAIDDYSEKLKHEQETLSILTGLSATELTCPSLDALDENALQALKPGPTVPAIESADAEAAAARARADQTHAGYYPKILALASVGDVEKTRFVDKKNYAVAVGVIFPLFDGFKTTYDVQAANSEASGREREADAVREELAEENSRYDQAIASAQMRLQHLKTEVSLAHDAFTTAKKRYLSLQGTLVDVREGLRNLVRTETQSDEAKAELLYAEGAKALANGAK